MSFDRITLTAKVEVKVRVKNSDAAFGAFSIPSTVAFEYNLKTRETSNETLTIETPSNFSNITMDIESLKEIMNGNYAKAIELIPNGGVVVREIKSNYDDIKAQFEAKHRPENVYFASVRFVRFAGLGTAARWVAEAIASGGSASAAIMAEAKREALRELNLVVQFLLSRSQAFGIATAEQLATTILSGGKPAWPNGEFPQIAFRFQKVHYSSRLKVAGAKVGGEFATNDHAAFVLIWIGQNGSTQAIDTIDPATIVVRDDVPDTPGGGNARDPQTLPLPEDKGLTNNTGNFKITFKNTTAKTLRVKTVRFSNADPQVFSIDLQPGNSSQPATFLGGSTRGLAAWSLSDRKLTSLRAEPIYQTGQISIVDRTGLPVPEDQGSINQQKQFSIQFVNQSQRAIRMKTVRVTNDSPVVFSTDIAAGSNGPTGLFFGGSTRILAVWSDPEGNLLLLEPLPIYESRCVIYKELVEALSDGTTVTRPFLEVVTL